jgi:hypothetical protein
MIMRAYSTGSVATDIRDEMDKGVRGVTPTRVTGCSKAKAILELLRHLLL